MKIIKYLILFIPVLLMTACVQDEERIFDEDPAVRMQNAITEYKALLSGAANGWIVNYYPETNHSIGGYVMSCKFSSDGKVDVTCELATNLSAFTAATSDWDVIPYQGPVLTFNTYNSVMHYFSEVSSTSDRDGRAGDYEFVVMKAVQDTIYLKGLRGSNRIVMWRASENPVDYLRQVDAFATKVRTNKNFSFSLNGNEIGTASASTTITNSLLNRKLSITYTKQGETPKDTTVTIYYTFTPNGFVLYEPFVANGVSMTNFTWDNAARKYICSDPGVTAEFICQDAAPIDETTIATYKPDPGKDVVGAFIALKNNGGTSSRFVITLMSSKLEAWRSGLKAAYPVFQEFRIEAPRSSYELSLIFVNNDSGTKYNYWNYAAGFTKLANPYYEVAFPTSTRSYTTGWTCPYLTDANYTGFKAFIEASTGFTLFQDGDIFWFRSNVDSHDWFKVEAY